MIDNTKELLYLAKTLNIPLLKTSRKIKQIVPPIKEQKNVHIVTFKDIFIIKERGKYNEFF